MGGGCGAEPLPALSPGDARAAEAGGGLSSMFGDHGGRSVGAEREWGLVRARGAPRALEVVSADPLRALFDSHYGAMVRLAALLLGESAGAEDVVQEAYVAVNRQLSRLDPEVHPAYLRRAVINGARSASRWNRALKRQVVVPVEETTDTESAVLRQDRRRQLSAALALLPGRQRHCLVLRYYGGMSDTEIAEHLGLAAGSVKNHIRRGRHALQLKLGDLG
jgi:RNA polymerase sigma factor (sigma-70 family)